MEPAPYELILGCLLGEADPEICAALQAEAQRSPDLRARFEHAAKLLAEMQAARTGAADWQTTAAQRQALYAIFRPTAQAGWLAAGKQLIEEIAAVLLDSARQSGPAVGFRGVSADRHMVLAANDLEIDLRLTATEPVESNRLALSGQITSPTPPSRVELEWLDPSPAEVVHAFAPELTPDGYFSLDVPSGVYELRVFLPDRIVLTPRIHLQQP